MVWIKRLAVLVSLLAVVGVALYLKSPRGAPSGPLPSGFLYEAPAEASPASAKPDSRLVRADNEFGFDLLSRLQKADSGTNLFISPPSIAIALQMTMNGAGGDTWKGMAKAMKLGELTEKEANEANRNLHATLVSPEPQIQLEVANALWGDKDVPFEPGFIERDGKYFQADLARLDFASPSTLDRINDWAGERTHGRIPTILEELDPAAFLVLTNAVYFKGEWAERFNEKATRDGSFKLETGATKPVKMMHKEARFRYLEEKEFQAVELPYGEGRWNMYVFLPRDEKGLGRFVDSLDAGSWERWMSRFQDGEVRVAMPKFKMEYETELADLLRQTEMAPAFTPGLADFTRMVPPPVDTPFISNVIHKTFLEVNEKGSEAAAVTAVVMKGSGLPIPTPSIVVDHPFFCAIADSKTGLVLFAGAVFEPGE